MSAEYRQKRGDEEKAEAKPNKAQVTSVEDAVAVALRTMRLHLELGEVDAALAVYNKSKRSLVDWRPTESDWLNLIQGVLGQNAWNDAVAVMRDYVERTAEPSPRVRLEAGSGPDPEAGTSAAGAEDSRQDSASGGCQGHSRRRGGNWSRRPSKCARMASSSCRMKCGESQSFRNSPCFSR